MTLDKFLSVLGPQFSSPAQVYCNVHHMSVAVGRFPGIMPVIVAGAYHGLDSCLYLENPHPTSVAMDRENTREWWHLAPLRWFLLEYDMLNLRVGSRTWDN